MTNIFGGVRIVTSKLITCIFLCYFDNSLIFFFCYKCLSAVFAYCLAYFVKNAVDIEAREKIYQILLSNNIEGQSLSDFNSRNSKMIW